MPDSKLRYDILNSLKRRPQSERDITALFGEEAKAEIARLIYEGRLKSSSFGDETFLKVINDED